MITRSTATTAFQAIKSNAWEVRTTGVPEDASLMLEDIAAATDADLASAPSQDSLRSALTLTRDAAAKVAASTRQGGIADPVTQRAIARADAVVAACNAALS